MAVAGTRECARGSCAGRGRGALEPPQRALGAEGRRRRLVERRAEGVSHPGGHRPAAKERTPDGRKAALRRRDDLRELFVPRLEHSSVPRDDVEILVTKHRHPRLPLERVGD
eukprot:CAMPEP_0176103942 /NCGR_PEP_ID=MMETSP0120_2-20121206/52151_1 /TAXON_ID=160619 /ORGANISM="Kryptoperidinium foliaceum, Strain CCMP 1326" /LENGTH=111 /DNA_ID=CAMNT_0017438035 /DNA_START=95 /DNA_END=430 /DNA_ORIENTATION=-